MPGGACADAGEAVVERARTTVLPGGAARPQHRIAQILAQDQQALGVGFDPAIVLDSATSSSIAPSGVFGTVAASARGLLVQPIPGVAAGCFA